MRIMFGLVVVRLKHCGELSKDMDAPQDIGSYPIQSSINN